MKSQSSQWRYRQVTCERDLSNTNFSNGQLKFLYRMPNSQQVNLDKSFLRCRLKLSRFDGTQLTKNDQIAPSYLMSYGLIKQMYQYMNGTEVCQMRNYVPQIGALRHRISYPESYKEKFLATTNFAKKFFEDRQNDVISDGYEGTKNQNTYYDRCARLDAQLVWNNIANAVGGDTITFDFDNGTAGESAFTWTDAAVATRVLFREGGVATGALDPAFVAANIDVGSTIYYTVNGNTYQSTVLRIETAGPLEIDGNTSNTMVIVRQNFVVEADQAFINPAGETFRIRNQANAVQSRRNQEMEIVWKPPMGLWNKDAWLPAHDLCLSMYPYPEGTWQKLLIESLTDKTHNTDYLLEIEDLIMYLCIKDAKHTDGEFDCEYEDMRCQLTNITTTSNVDHHFVVDRQAHSFTVALQDEDVENNSSRNATYFKIRDDQELKLTRLWVDYNGRVLPDPYPQISKTSAKDFLTQRWYESAYYSGANEHYDIESLDDWERLGMYFTVRFGKGYTQTEKVTVSTLFEAGAFGTGTAEHRPNLLLFDHFQRKFKMIVSGNKVREVHSDIVN